MCGIAGLIHRGKSSNVGSELQGMLQALKHRGEDSTGYALYGDTNGKNFIMRFKVGENVGEGSLGYFGMGSCDGPTVRCQNNKSFQLHQG